MDREMDPELHTIPPDRESMEGQPKWRQDFPIDTAQDGYLARREFTKYLGLTSLAFVAGQFWIALKNRWREARGLLPIVQITNINELANGSARTFNYPSSNDPAILLRLRDGTFLAFNSQCTHLQCPVVPDFENGHFHCPCHRGYFDLKTGRPLAGPPRRSLQRIALNIKNSTIYATGFEEEKT